MVVDNKEEESKQPDPSSSIEAKKPDSEFQAMR